MRKTRAAMAPGGRQSKRVTSIPPPEVTPTGSSRIPRRLKTTEAPGQHVPEDISPIAGNSTNGDNAVQAESPAVAETRSSPQRDWSYAYAGNDLDEDETEQNT